jgi:DNA-directed RNA polymerase subunit M/transcription elongation factor TFIIS
MSYKKIENPKYFRTKICENLEKILPNGKDASNLEKGIHNWTLKEAMNRKIIKKWDNPYFVRIYLDHLRSVFINITNTTCLVDQVNSGQIKSHEIAFMTHQEMDYNRWETLIKAKSVRDMNKCEQTMEANTDTYTCRKCHSKKCSYYQQQVRGADEPMTIFINCVNCGNRWKN